MKIGVSDPNYGDTLAGSVGTSASAGAAAAVESHELTVVSGADASGAHPASGIALDDGANHPWPLLALSSAGSGGGGYYAAADVEGALAEVGAAIATLAGAAPAYWPMLSLSSGPVPTVSAHLLDPVDAHDASAISIVDAGGYYAATDVEGALAEVMAAPSRVWMPLTTVSAWRVVYWPMLALTSDPSVGRVPELVWDGSDSLIPTQVPP